MKKTLAALLSVVSLTAFAGPPNQHQHHHNHRPNYDWVAPALVGVGVGVMINRANQMAQQQPVIVERPVIYRTYPVVVQQPRVIVQRQVMPNPPMMECSEWREYEIDGRNYRERTCRSFD